MDFSRYWSSRQKQVESALDRLLPGSGTRPKTIHEAMRYSIFAGGKRLRPVICLAAAEAVGGRAAAALPLACAVECVHTYSLIHDDLPSMDNDDFRRGKPTSHKVYGEGIAILAGDALLTIAFEMTAKARPASRHPTAALVLELARAAGSRALVAGQVADLEGEGRSLKLPDLRFIHANKTAALIASSIRLGAMSANATTRQLAGLTEFGRSLGLAFQVIDDILDVTQTTEKLGKSAGKDAAAQKSTYPALLGLDGAKREADRLTARAHAALKSLGKKAEALAAIAEYLLRREN